MAEMKHFSTLFNWSYGLKHLDATACSQCY